MLKETIAAMLVVTGVVVASAREGNVIARFDGGIGVIPVTGGAGTPNADGTLPNVKLNVVRSVSPAGPWRIADLKAVVNADGGISVKGKGLLLASGNSIGTNANASVFATLICETAAPFVLHNTGSRRAGPGRQLHHLGHAGPGAVGLREPRVADSKQRQRRLVRGRDSEARQATSSSC